VEDEDDEEVDENAFDLKGSVIYQPFNSTDNLRALSGKRNANVDEPGTLMRARTSSQLVDMAKDSVQEDQQRIADFIKQIKAGEVQTQTTSEFRARRLTYSVKTEDDMAPSTPVNPFGGGSPSIKADPGSGSRKQSSMRQVRTTIFASSEIGTVTEKPPPFPDSVLGTYSCHGIEPAHDDGETVHEKINQDRGCVVCPYNSKRNEALFMVLDGHGSEGDKVSEFVMRQVRFAESRPQSCAAGPRHRFVCIALTSALLFFCASQIVVSLEKDVLLNIDPVAALKNSFVQTNAALLVTKINYVTSGCTCVTVYVRDKRLYVANVGDSRAVMAYKPTPEEVAARVAAVDPDMPVYEDDLPIEERYMSRDLTRDHKPDDPEEMARIISWGGYVCPPAETGLSARVYLDPNFTMIGLAMARSIGACYVLSVMLVTAPYGSVVCVYHPFTTSAVGERHCYRFLPLHQVTTR
jgi:serine/threonine protein phosphatase PrpC